MWEPSQNAFSKYALHRILQTIEMLHAVDCFTITHPLIVLIRKPSETQDIPVPSK